MCGLSVYAKNAKLDYDQASCYPFIKYKAFLALRSTNGKQNLRVKYHSRHLNAEILESLYMQAAIVHLHAQQNSKVHRLRSMSYRFDFRRLYALFYWLAGCKSMEKGITGSASYGHD